jgi:hypothetical protein
MPQPIDELFSPTYDFSLLYTTDPTMATHKGEDKMPVQGGFIVMQPSVVDYTNLIDIVMNTEYHNGKLLPPCPMPHTHATFTMPPCHHATMPPCPFPPFHSFDALNSLHPLDPLDFPPDCLSVGLSIICLAACLSVCR